jgi:hypothetical protein
VIALCGELTRFASEVRVCENRHGRGLSDEKTADLIAPAVAARLTQAFE